MLDCMVCGGEGRLSTLDTVLDGSNEPALNKRLGEAVNLREGGSRGERERGSGSIAPGRAGMGPALPGLCPAADTRLFLFPFLRGWERCTTMGEYMGQLTGLFRSHNLVGCPGMHFAAVCSGPCRRHSIDSSFQPLLQASHATRCISGAPRAAARSTGARRRSELGPCS